MPTLGNRIPVKLPWKGATDNSDQFVSMKGPVAEFFGFDQASKEELTYEVKVRKKDKGDGTKVPGETTVKRRRRPGYRQRSVRIIFQMGKAGAGARASTITGSQVKVGTKTYKSLQFPITPSVPIGQIIEYFETGKGKKLKALKVIDANSGQGYPILQ